MVEGHQCHRVAAAHRKLLVGKRFQAKSPNGRFQQGAEAVDGKVLSRIEVIGKNMFYFFGGGASPSASPVAVQLLGHAPVVPSTSSLPKANPSAVASSPPGRPSQPKGKKGKRSSRGSDQQQAGAEGAKEVEDVVWIEDDDGEVAGAPARGEGHNGAQQQQQQQQQEVAVVAAGRDGTEPMVVRIHFGMSGAFKVSTSFPGPDPTPTTRLSLTNREHGLVGHLSAMTVEMGGEALFKDWEQRLGPDPLREDADGERLWRAMQTSKKPVGLALMTQEMIAGLGNIYRAEVLFKAGVHPEQPCRTVPRPTFDLLWHHSVSLLQRGFSTGSIITVDPEEAKKLGKPWTRRYIYNQRQCGRCKGTVRTWDMAARTVYCCETCQPLLTESEAPAAATPGKRDKKSEEKLVTPPPKRGDGTDAAGPSSSAAAVPKRKKPRAGKADSAAAAAAGGEVKEEGEEVEAAKPVAASLLSPARLAAMQAAVPARVFQSHCAHDDEETMQAKMAQMGSDSLPAKKTQKAGSKQTVAQLKEELKARGLGTTGTKAVLLERLAAAEAPSTDSPQPLVPEAATAATTAATATAAEAAPAPAAVSTKAKAAAALKERASPVPVPATPAAAATVPVPAKGLPHNSKRRGYKPPAADLDGEDEVDRAERLLADQLGVPGADTLAKAAPAVAVANNTSKAEDRESNQPRSKKQRTTATNGTSANPASMVKPGTRDLPMASPEEAAQEKAEAGENRAVEHVPF